MKRTINNKLSIHVHETKKMQDEIKAKSNFIQENVRGMERDALEKINTRYVQDVNHITKVLGEIEAKCQFAYDFVKSVDAINDAPDDEVLELYAKTRNSSFTLPRLQDLPEVPSKKILSATARNIDGVISAFQKITRKIYMSEKRDEHLSPLPFIFQNMFSE